MRSPSRAATPVYLDQLYAMIEGLGCGPGEDYVVRLEVRRPFWWGLVRAWTFTWPDRPEGTLQFRTVVGRSFRVTVERWRPARPDWPKLLVWVGCLIAAAASWYAVVWLAAVLR